MNATTLTCLVALTATGCIFGGGEWQNLDANSSANSSTTGPHGDVGVGGGDGGQPDMEPPAETFLQLGADSEACINPRTAYFGPATLVDAVLTADSYVATAAAPIDFVNSFTSIGQISVAHATSRGGALHVYAGVATLPESTPEFEELHGDEATIDIDAEVWGLLLSPASVFRNETNLVSNLLFVTVATSRGVYECRMTIDLEDETAFGCVRSAINSVLETRQIAPPARLELAPVFETLPSDEYRFNVFVPTYLGGVSGPIDGGEELTLLRLPRDGNPSTVVVDELESALGRERIFAERLAFGVEDSAFGQPLLVTLGKPTGGGRYGPQVLRADSPRGTSYVLEDRGVWNLSQALRPQRGTFTFVDGYEIEINGWAGFARFEPGELLLGYVGIREDQSGLIFSRPGGFAGADYLAFALPNVHEVTAHKNIPLEVGSSGRSVIAAIHGPERDRLALFDWGFGIDAKWVDDLLGPSFTDAQRMGPVWFYSDAGTISMLAQFNGEWVNAIVRIPDLQDLSQSCL